MRLPQKSRDRGLPEGVGLYPRPQGHGEIRRTRIGGGFHIWQLGCPGQRAFHDFANFRKARSQKTILEQTRPCPSVSRMMR